MTQEQRPPVRKMIQEALDALGDDTTNVAIKDWILRRYPGTNVATIQAQTLACTVNQASRVYYPENGRARTANDDRYDFLFRSARGHVQRYDSARHGQWAIVEREEGGLAVVELEDREGGAVPVPSGGDAPVLVVAGGTAFAAETHLRDYLARNLEVIEQGLSLFVDDSGSAGVEYVTPIGRIDILAVDVEGGLVVVELKVGRGSDAVCGQLLRYRGWIKQHLAEGRRVRGMIIAESISDRIRYAMMDVDDVHLMEYDLRVTLRDASASAG